MSEMVHLSARVLNALVPLAARRGLLLPRRRLTDDALRCLASNPDEDFLALRMFGPVALTEFRRSYPRDQGRCEPSRDAMRAEQV